VNPLFRTKDLAGQRPLSTNSQHIGCECHTEADGGTRILTLENVSIVSTILSFKLNIRGRVESTDT
jgi:hypothetical protein